MRLAAAVTLAAVCALAMPAARSSEAACDVVALSPVGTYVAIKHLHGPGLVLAGSGGLSMPPSVLAWMHDRLVGGGARGGNVVVLRATGDNEYDRPFYKAGNFAFVRTVRIPPCASRAAVDAAARFVERADAVFFSGGDQSHYVAWKGSRLIAAVKGVYARGGIVGGGSAGLAIQGAVIYDAVAADRVNNDTHTADAVKYPYERRISFTTGFFNWRPLARTITDTHFVARNRFGRLAVFIARIVHDGLLGNGERAYGLGVDQGSAVVVGPDGVGTVLNAAGGRGAYLLRSPATWHAAMSQPIDFTVAVSHIARNGERFDLVRKRTGDGWYSITVHGAAPKVYSRSPY